MDIERNKRIVRELFDALSRADSKRVLDLYADDVEVWTSGRLPFSGTYGRDEVAPRMEGILGAFPEGLEFVIRGMTAEGDRVAVEAESRGVHASGKPYNNLYHFLVVIRDGRVRQFKEYMDTMHADEVLVQGAGG